MLGLGLKTNRYNLSTSGTVPVVPLLSTVATANGTDIILTYDIALDETSTPATTDFSFS